MQTILIDDEQKAIDALTSDIHQWCPQLEIVASCTSGKEAWKTIHKHRPELVFLDIDMPQMTGFDLLKKFDTIFFDVIFCTAHSQYAIDAFRISAVVDYLLKPIKKEHLLEAVSRVQSRRTRGLSSDHFEVLLDNLRGHQKIALRSGDGFDFIAIDQIVYCQSDGNYITLFLSDDTRKMYSVYTMKYLEERLSSSLFCRIHQSYLVNLNYIDQFDWREGFVLLQNGEKLPVSRGGKGELRRRMGVW